MGVHAATGVQYGLGTFSSVELFNINAQLGVSARTPSQRVALLVAPCLWALSRQRSLTSTDLAFEQVLAIAAEVRVRLRLPDRGPLTIAIAGQRALLASEWKNHMTLHAGIVFAL